MLTVTDVTARIDDQVLLPPASLEVVEGECVAITGPNGSGKTTLLRIVTGRLAPTEGEALLDGEPVDERSATTRASIAALLGVPAMYPDLTIGDHLALVHATWQLDAADVDADLDRFSIGALRDRFVHELSSGQQQLFSLALTFARPARLIVLDEPEQRLDGHRTGLLAEAVVTAVAEGQAVVMACHDHGLVERAARRRVEL
ncbi:ATP-binding cassette domain-containing protein [Aeromicrobium phragmitis]|uniref:ATP-binding cassette domain-containing protein n=1 Tax=Aeromicrobium phragmitis TaxID=2478914 RepID=A0A3L8PPU1_9ACTN|nr:ATP-binding cassette domain-containing protein [Aeromicrobium phragmitis]RLV57204.1 ATP-binding cassette domain-containing protein [Aeromicrobium phragmitis]